MIIYGLVFNYQSVLKPVPLQNVKVEANVVDMIAEVTISQTYKNVEEETIEAIYKFPIYEGAAICSFEADVDGRKIVGVVKEAKEAAQEYETAVQEGYGAYLLEEQLPDVFQTSVGNLKSNQTVIIKITYVTELKHDNESEKIRFTLPTVVSPRYGSSDLSPTNPSAATGKKIVGDNPPYATNSVANYTLSLDITCRMTDFITSVESPSNLISTELNIDGNPKVAKITLAEDITFLEKDFVLVLKSKGLDEPRAFIEYNPNTETTCAMLTLVPKFSLNAGMCELVFVVDRSGSMAGGPMKRAAQAVQLILRSLPEDCFFNIVSFGSRYDSLFPQSQPYSEESFKRALAHAESMIPNYGGTEIYKVLNWVFDNVRNDMPTSVFLLTDGEVWNVDQIAELVRTTAAKPGKNGLRLFTLGIGASVSHNLVESLARAGKGYAQFVTNEERMDKKVVGMVKNSIKPPITDYKILWTDYEIDTFEENADQNTLVEGKDKPTISIFNKDSDKQETPSLPSVDFHKSTKIQQAPFEIPPLYSGVRFVVYAMLAKGVEARQTIKLTAHSHDGPLELEVPIDPVVLQGSKIHTLSARKLIQDLEEGGSFLHNHPKYKGTVVQPSIVRETVISLGITHSLASRYTSFIAVDKELKTETAEIKIRKQEKKPQQLYIYGASSVGGNVSSYAGFPPPVTMLNKLSGRSSVSAVKSTRKGNYKAAPMMAGRNAQLKEAASVSVPMMRISGGITTFTPDFGTVLTGYSSVLPPAGSSRVDFGSAPAMETSALDKEGISRQTPLSDPKKAAIETLYAFLKLQSFDGKFSPSENESEFSELFDGKGNDVAWHTAVAIAYLEIVMKEFQEEWILCFEKAERALSKLLSGKDDKVEEILSEAKDWVRKWVGGS